MSYKMLLFGRKTTDLCEDGSIIEYYFKKRFKRASMKCIVLLKYPGKEFLMGRTPNTWPYLKSLSHMKTDTFSISETSEKLIFIHALLISLLESLCEYENDQ